MGMDNFQRQMEEEIDERIEQACAIEREIAQKDADRHFQAVSIGLIRGSEQIIQTGVEGMIVGDVALMFSRQIQKAYNELMRLHNELLTADSTVPEHSEVRRENQ